MDSELAGMVRERHARQAIRDVLASYSRGIETASASASAFEGVSHE
jgi:hypothetical protein